MSIGIQYSSNIALIVATAEMIEISSLLLMSF